MRKFLITVIVLNTILWFGLSSLAKANDYNTAVIGHVITQKVTGQGIDTSKLMEQELQRVGHLYAIEMIGIMQKYLPSILDGIAADLRLQADKRYKCELLKGSANGCK